MKGCSQCPIFLLRFMNISGDERNKAWGSSRWKNSIISREVQTLTLFLHAEVHKTRTGGRAGGRARTHTHSREVFSICNQSPVQRTLHVRLRCPFVFGIKVPACHKSQILYDMVEIALSKMQSAKAAWSADELPWLRERQWLVSFAPIGSIQDEHLGDLEESRRRLPPFQNMNGSRSFEVELISAAPRKI